MLYLTFKALHFVALIAWFAGMFYIWRLFVYHAETDSEHVRKTLAVMEHRLYRIIMVPASTATLLFGLATLSQVPALMQSAWIWVKLAFVAGLFALQFLANHYRKRLGAGERFDSKRFRILNEVPTLILIAVVLLAVFKPF